MRATLFTLFLTAGLVSAQEATSDPIGFNKVTCLANSDTIVGVPLRKEGSMQTTLSGAPTGTGDSITLPVTATLTAGQYTKHYVKFTSGTKDGSWYDITTNTTNSITIDLNGDSLTGVVTGDGIVIAEYWTLDTLFPPATATTDPTTTGHAIVASTSTSARNRKTQVLIPNFLASNGINQAPSKICYIYNQVWYAADGSPLAGSTVIDPDVFITIRHPASVTSSTVFRTLGEVVKTTVTIPLTTLTTGPQDSYISLLRPIDVRLDQLGLVSQSGTSAFVTSSSTSPRNRKDQLLVFDNTQQLINKSPSAIYYYSGGHWLNAMNNNAVSDEDLIKAGQGFLIRKAQTTTGATSYWINQPTY